MGRRGCASAMGMIKFPSSCSSPKALCNQFIDYYICSRGVFCINHIKLRNFVVITIECSIATVDRGSIMTRIYRWSMMVYSSLQAEFMVTNLTWELPYLVRPSFLLRRPPGVLFNWYYRIISVSVSKIYYPRHVAINCTYCIACVDSYWLCWAST